MITAATHGAPHWADLATPRVAAAMDFYRRLFGWVVESSVTPMGEYFIGKVGGRQVVGMMAQGPGMVGMPAAWTTYVYVADVDATASRAADAGGSIAQAPFDIPDGRVAVLSDPAGADLGVVAGPAPDGGWLGREHGRVCWVELLTRDPAAAEGFYGAVFGWKAETRQSGTTPYTTFSVEDGDVGGMRMMSDTLPADVPSHWSPYFAVDDCPLAVRRAADLGGRVLMPVTDIDIGRLAVLADPDGASFDVLEFAEQV